MFAQPELNFHFSFDRRVKFIGGMWKLFDISMNIAFIIIVYNRIVEAYFLYLHYYRPQCKHVQKVPIILHENYRTDFLSIFIIANKMVTSMRNDLLKGWYAFFRDNEIRKLNVLIEFLWSRLSVEWNGIVLFDPDVNTHVNIYYSNIEKKRVLFKWALVKIRRETHSANEYIYNTQAIHRNLLLAINRETLEFHEGSVKRNPSDWVPKSINWTKWIVAKRLQRVPPFEFNNKSE